MGTVYLARDMRPTRQVAIKVLHPELAAVLGAKRFLAEIKTTANLQQPHILPRGVIHRDIKPETILPQGGDGLSVNHTVRKGFTW